jgi:hypothetical protein
MPDRGLSRLFPGSTISGVESASFQPYDRLAQFATAFEDRKGIEVFFQEARLPQQKQDLERLQTFRE